MDDLPDTQSDKGIRIHSAWRRRRDVFVHISAIERGSVSWLKEGQTVEYEVESNRGKESAVNLKIR